MHFKLPGKKPIEFEIHDKWWFEADMHNFTRFSNSYEVLKNKPFKIISITDIKPPLRALGLPDFKEYKMLPILNAIRNQNPLPPIEIIKIDDSYYAYRPYDGFHRFYASVAVEYSEIPVTIRDWT